MKKFRKFNMKLHFYLAESYNFDNQITQDLVKTDLDKQKSLVPFGFFNSLKSYIVIVTDRKKRNRFGGVK